MTRHTCAAFVRCDVTQDSPRRCYDFTRCDAATFYSSVVEYMLPSQELFRRLPPYIPRSGSVVGTMMRLSATAVRCLLFSPPHNPRPPPPSTRVCLYVYMYDPIGQRGSPRSER